MQHTIIARAWHNAGLQPPRLERYRRSTDPDFETKAADVIGLYLDPPQHAVVFCIDENPAIQARIHLIEKFQKLLVAMPTMTLLGSLSRWRR